ncbi:hypothetical protein N8I74_12680 [Chitiniphilus purpureus]|uniref:Uncharacterized protein n=1 Tax=Chitiniphilus purpureus TaxID=2981137 RepID=A0ABY6DQI3_9NEIS|nr:hypothetical protein [Chitiniphilus sp. CD1]UXY14173.1 hypothetical protein N8I74_12680 [Chitiniphilus sp. CD1]
MNMVSDMEERAALDDGVARFLGVCAQDGELRLSDIRSKAASELKRYGDDLVTHLTQQGVTVPPAIQIAGTEDGRITVLGEHPAKEQIETLVNNDTRLLKWFKEIEVLFEILRRSELRGTEAQLEAQRFNLGLTSIGSVAFFSLR